MTLPQYSLQYLTSPQPYGMVVSSKKRQQQGVGMATTYKDRDGSYRSIFLCDETMVSASEAIVIFNDVFGLDTDVKYRENSINITIVKNSGRNDCMCHTIVLDHGSNIHPYKLIYILKEVMKLDFDIIVKENGHSIVLKNDGSSPTGESDSCRSTEDNNDEDTLRRWRDNDFVTEGNVITGLSVLGREKLFLGNGVIDSFPDRITTIGKYAFQGTKVTAIKDWGNITRIGNYAFSDSNLSSIPDSWGKVTSIGECAFADTSIDTMPL